MALELNLPRLALYCQDMILSDWATLQETEFAGLDDETKQLLDERRAAEFIDTSLDDDRNNGDSNSLPKITSLSNRLATARAAGGRLGSAVKGKMSMRFNRLKK